MSLETKILKALEDAVKEENISDSSIGPAFDVGGEKAFMRELVGALEAPEKQRLFIEWIVDNAEASETSCILDLILDYHFTREALFGVSHRLLKHFNSEVREFLHEHNKV